MPKVKDILKLLDGITRWDLISWERQGYFKTKKVTKGKVKRTIYFGRDLPLIKTMWKFRKEGFPPALAYKKAMEELKGLASKLETTGGLTPFAAPKGGSGFPGTHIKLKKLEKATEKIKIAVERNSPKIIVAFSCISCLVVGIVLPTVKNKFKISVVPFESIDKTSLPLVKAYLENLKLEECGLLVHEGDEKAKKLISELDAESSILNYISLNIYPSE